ncbi:MAG: MerR family transcriptional regulator [Ferruginibacter sp.]|nr:MerR family transcriptional regulator [Ferruginibacter sp.]
MQTEQFIQADTFCVYHNVEFSFITRLQEYGLIEITTKEDKAFIPESDLEHIEKLVRLHNDLHINLEGVEVVSYLLEQLKKQQEQLNLLQNKLRFYEP